MLVLALDLKEVEEIRATGVDLDQVFRGMRRWCWECGYEEVLRPGDVLCHLDGFHLKKPIGRFLEIISRRETKKRNSPPQLGKLRNVHLYPSSCGAGGSV